MRRAVLTSRLLCARAAAGLVRGLLRRNVGQLYYIVKTYIWCEATRCMMRCVLCMLCYAALRSALIGQHQRAALALALQGGRPAAS